MDISSIRKEYKLKSLSEGDVMPDPIGQFAEWFGEAIAAEVLEVNAMVFASSTLKGRPSGRVVLLKDYDKQGFVFFTNYQSQKGVEILENPYGCLTFFWPQLERQIRIEGKIEKVSEEESLEYFNSRPWESRVGAWVSKQSSEIGSRKELEQRYQDLDMEFKAKGHVPKPEYWGGYRLCPNFLEFWQGRPSRLHDRICYELEGDSWRIYRLSP